ncbi:MAG: molybdopterin-guanine dinucleotide biosynthesis protein B [Thalassobaculales bacterium]
MPGKPVDGTAGRPHYHPTMRILGIAGWSGSGKTTLLTSLIPALVARGLTVSTVKHAHHGFDVDQPGKDSYVHRAAGAHEVLVTSANRWALMHENRGAPEPGLADLLPRLAPVDLVLVEGFKRDSHPKIEVHRPALGKPLLAASDPSIIAVACDVPLPGLAARWLDLNDHAAIVGFVADHARG